MQRRDSCLVGCGVAAVVALCSLLALAMVLKRGTGWVRERVQYYQAWQDLDRDWRPPSGDLDQERGWPKSIRGYALALHDDEATVPAWGLQGPGNHARYEKGSQHIDVYSFPRRPEERERWLEDLAQTVGRFEGQGDGVRRKVQKRAGSLLTFHVGPPATWAAAWSHKAWAFVALSDSEPEVELFLFDYLRLLSPAGASDPIGPKPPE